MPVTAPLFVKLSNPENKALWVAFILSASKEELVSSLNYDQAGLYALVLDTLPQIPAEFVALAWYSTPRFDKCMSVLSKWSPGIFDSCLEAIYNSDKNHPLYPKAGGLPMFLRFAHQKSLLTSALPGLAEGLEQLLLRPKTDPSSSEEVCQILVHFADLIGFPKYLASAAYRFARSLAAQPHSGRSSYAASALLFHLTLLHPKWATDEDLIYGCSVTHSPNYSSALDEYIKSPHWTQNLTLATQILVLRHQREPSQHSLCLYLAYLKTVPLIHHPSVVFSAEDQISLPNADNYANLWELAHQAKFRLPAKHFARFVSSPDKALRLEALKAAERFNPALTPQVR